MEVIKVKNLIIETKKLNKKYGKQIVVNNVDLHIEQGEIYGLLGRNGAGKTTIMKMILGLVSITSGEINVFGQKLKGNEQQIYPRIGAIIETPGFYPNLTGTENLRIFAKLRGMTRKDCIKHALDLVGLSYNDKKLFSEYSLGMKQRLGIANAVMHEPELLILDEPTNGLDPIGIVEMREFIRDLCKKNGITILISSHILTEIEQLADTIGIIDHGILLEESSYKDLQKKNRKYILLKVSSTSNAIRVLEQKMGIHDYEVENDTMLRIYEIDRNMGEINKLLITNNIEVLSSQFCSDTLEDYFKNITGGEGIV